MDTVLLKNGVKCTLFKISDVQNTLKRHLYMTKIKVYYLYPICYLMFKLHYKPDSKYQITNLI